MPRLSRHLWRSPSDDWFAVIGRPSSLAATLRADMTSTVSTVSDRPPKIACPLNVWLKTSSERAVCGGPFKSIPDNCLRNIGTHAHDTRTFSRRVTHFVPARRNLLTEFSLRWLRLMRSGRRRTRTLPSLSLRSWYVSVPIRVFHKHQVQLRENDLHVIDYFRIGCTVLLWEVARTKVRRSKGPGFNLRSRQMVNFHGVKIGLSTLGTGDVPSRHCL